MRHLCTAITILILIGCSTPSPQEKEALQIDRFAKEVKDEVQIGRGMAAKLLGTFGHYKNKKATKYVNLVGQTLAKNVGRPELKFHFAILDSDELNAFATPGGYILITKGLLKVMRSESELAAVLGHEIAHINLKHMYKEIMPKREVETGEHLTRILSRGQSDISASFSKIISAGLKMLLEDGLGKEKEFESDHVGITYSATLGYNPIALRNLLNRIHKNEGSIKVSKTHPPHKERMIALNRFFKKNGFDKSSLAKEKTLKKRFKKYFSKL